MPQGLLAVREGPAQQQGVDSAQARGLAQVHLGAAQRIAFQGRTSFLETVVVQVRHMEEAQVNDVAVDAEAGLVMLLELLKSADLGDNVEFRVDVRVVADDDLAPALQGDGHVVGHGTDHGGMGDDGPAVFAEAVLVVHEIGLDEHRIPGLDRVLHGIPVRGAETLGVHPQELEPIAHGLVHWVGSG